MCPLLTREVSAWLGGLSGRGFGGLEPPPGVEGSQLLGAPPDGIRFVEMATDDEVKAGAGGSALLFGHLEADALAADGVVSLHHAFILEAENLLEIDAAEGDEGAHGIGGPPRELEGVGRHAPVGAIAGR